MNKKKNNKKSQNEKKFKFLKMPNIDGRNTSFPQPQLKIILANSQEKSHQISSVYLTMLLNLIETK